MRILLWFFVFALALQAKPICADFQKGVDAYEAGQFQAATSVWDACVQEGARHADLYYNMGNAEFRLGNLGRAIWNYEMALRLQPGLDDAERNLQYAQSKRVDKLEGNASEENPVLTVLRRVHHSLSLNQELILLAVFAWIAFFLVLAFTWLQSEFWRNLIKAKLLILGMVSGLLLMHILFKAHAYESDEAGIVLVRSADVMSGPGDQYQVLHELHEGTRVEILEQQEGWASIRLGDAIKGFVELSELGVVR